MKHLNLNRMCCWLSTSAAFRCCRMGQNKGHHALKLGHKIRAKRMGHQGRVRDSPWHRLK